MHARGGWHAFAARSGTVDQPGTGRAAKAWHTPLVHSFPRTRYSGERDDWSSRSPFPFGAELPVCPEFPKVGKEMTSLAFFRAIVSWNVLGSPGRGNVAITDALGTAEEERAMAKPLSLATEPTRGTTPLPGTLLRWSGGDGEAPVEAGQVSGTLKQSNGPTAEQDMNHLVNNGSHLGLGGKPRPEVGPDVLQKLDLLQ